MKINSKKRIFALVLVFFVNSSFAQKQVSPSLEWSVASSEVEDLIMVLQQADSLHREMHAILTKTTRKTGVSIFAKLASAVADKKHANNPFKKMKSNCDSYATEVKSDGSLDIFENCEGQNELGHLEFSPQKKTVSILVSVGTLAKVLGPKTAVFGKKFRCEIGYGEQGKMLKLDCAGWTQDYDSDDYYVATTYRFNRAGKVLAVMQAEVRKTFDLVKNLTVEVPLSGNVKVIEQMAKPFFELPPEVRSADSLKNAIRTENGKVPDSASSKKQSDKQALPPPLRPVTPDENQ